MWKRLPILALLALAGGASAAAPSDALTAFTRHTQGCSPTVKHCFGVVLHVVLDERGKPVQTADWLATQLAETNRHFGPIGVNFEIVDVRPLPPRFETVVTRADRDALGRKRYSRKVLHAFLVGRLHNVDEPGEIRGVHWRLRGRRSRHWVVLASIAPDWVLAHEIGHFFGLPHSRYPISIMNKSPREEPPEAERTFAKPEYARMKRRLKRFIRSRELLKRKVTP